jgi:hypothetical protein
VGHLRLVTFGRDAVKEGLDYVRQRAYSLTKNDNAEAETLFVTGVGCTEHGKLVSKTLNVK